MKNIQNGIEALLKKHKLIPVVTINKIEEVDPIINALVKKNIKCIEVTLRTAIAFEAVEYIKKHYGNEISVGIGTVTNTKQVDKAVKIGIDFIVSPGISIDLSQALIDSKIPFIPGIATPSEILLGIQLGWKIFKFFPANLFGGVAALKTYKNVFPDILFCPTGGITEKSYTEYLALQNVKSIGGSWMLSKN